MLVSAEEGLGAREDVPDDYGGAEGVEDVFVVGVQQQSIIDVAWVVAVVPEKPITALMSRSFSI